MGVAGGLAPRMDFCASSPAERLTRRDAFQAIFRQGTRVERPSVLVLWRRAAGGRRVGFAVSSQVRGAVRRNRAKRRLREACRQTANTLPGGIELVCVARTAAVEAPFEVVRRDMREAFAAIARQLGPVPAP